MDFWRLVSPETFTSPPLVGHHSHWLCAIAVLLAIFSAWVLIPVTQRFHSTSSGYRFWWLVSGSIVMGTGIWAMHFTGMLAFLLPLKVEYNLIITILSGVPAVIATSCFILLYKQHEFSNKRMHLMALILALGIGAMHYIGMEAIKVDADMYYDPVYFFLSLLAAYVLAVSGVFSLTRMVDQTGASSFNSKISGSICFGLAVSCMHFIAMRATFFQPHNDAVFIQHAAPSFGLVMVVILTTLVLLVFTIISSIFDRRMQDLSRLAERSQNRFQSLAETTQTAIFTFNENHVTYANPALCRITGYSLEDIYQLQLSKLFDEEFEQMAQQIIAGTVKSGQVFHRQFRIMTAGNEEKWIYCSSTLEDFEDQLAGLCSAFDITEQKDAELNMRHLAYHDQLTQLYNRTVFMDRLSHHLELMNRRQSDSKSCVMILDLDKFKSINDSLGHLTGDKLLKTIAVRLRKVARSCDTMSRFGGDEFVLLIEDMDSRFNTDMIAQRILDCLEEPFAIDDRTIDIHTSIGIVELDSCYESPDQVLRDADIALYRAKEIGHGCWVIYDDTLDAAAKRLRKLHPELKNALRDNQLQMYYQPICAALDRRVLGFEALARWQRSNGEWVSPAEFIPLAEDSGLILDIGLWALESASIELAKFNNMNDDKDIYISINIDAQSLTDQRFYDAVVSAFDTFQLKRGQLKIELTERGLIQDTESILPRMNSLIELGCEFMIDDFGTGYSSLSYLHRLPIHSLKIDRSFVMHLDDDENSTPLVKTIITLAQSLNMAVVAEGVETEEQCRRLSQLGSQQLQGYYFAKPMPADAAMEFLVQQERFVVDGSIVNLWGSIPG